MENLFYPDQLVPLFEDVQRSKVFKDSKLFVDAIPLTSPDNIVSIYETEKTKAGFDIKQFLLQHFKFPQEPTSTYNSSERSITEHINALWNELLREPAGTEGSLIGLPYRYIVPGGRFREVYYWDSYFTMLGLEVADRLDIVEDMLKNFAHLIESVGFIPNGNRSYYLTRSQPPFYALMVDLLAKHRTKQQMEPLYAALEKEYDYWMKGSEGLQPGESFDHVICMEDGSILNRYWESRTTPRAEAFLEDLKTANASDRPTAEAHQHLRAACESGWDFSSRWQSDPKKISTIKAVVMVPVDLNCLLYYMEQSLGRWHAQAGRTEPADLFNTRAASRWDAITRYFWNTEQEFFTDYDIEEAAHAKQLTLAGLFPLFFKLATEEQAGKCEEKFRNEFLKDGGAVTTLEHSGQQWDAPNGWAPLQWIAYMGLMNYSFTETAMELRKRWMQLNEKVYAHTGRMMEKYNVEDISLTAGGGEYPNQDGFGWTNGVYLKFASLGDD